MPNNPTQDRYNPPGTRELHDFQKEKFSEINSNELFWLKASSNTDAYRKVDDNSAMNTKSRVVEAFNKNSEIYLRN